MNEPDEYDKEARRITDEIGRLKMVRDAQTQGSPNYHHFQSKIDDLTDALVLWEQAVPTIRQLDQRANAALAAAEDAERRVELAASNWNQVAAVSAVAGGFLILLSLVWTPSAWLPILGVLFALGAGGCVFGGIAARRTAQAVVDQHAASFEEAEDTKANLLPEGRSR